MKYLILLPLLFILFSFGNSPANSEQQPNQFNITSCKKDATVKKDQAKINFKLSTSLNAIVVDTVRMSYNGILATLRPDSLGQVSLSLKSGKYAFQFFLNSSHQEIYSDSVEIKGGCVTEILLVFDYVWIEVSPAKPVIYVYPDATQHVNIQLEFAGKLGFTYPAYENGWDFVADPDGTIHMNEKEYDYLFWDGESKINPNEVDLTTGFIVDKDSLADFFEAKLTSMGLSPRERQDFITYWCPLMQENKKSYVHFMFNEEYDTMASLKITPTPDHVFRVFMVWADANEMDKSNLAEQQIESFQRSGFSVVEWGGSEAATISDLL